VALGERRFYSEMKNDTVNLYGVPVFWWPYLAGDVEQNASPLRRLQFGKMRKIGWGVDSDWNFFRLLGFLEPDGYRADLDVEAGKDGVIGGVNLKYTRRTDDREYTGYWKFYNVWDRKAEDSFGRDEQDIAAPTERGRVLGRHKEFLPDGWQIQFEVSYYCDQNFLRAYFPDEYYAAKEQETVLYAQKQRDNWVFTSLLKYRLNRFQSQTEAWPDLGFQWIGEPLANGALTFFDDSRAGLLRFRPGNAVGKDSDAPPDPNNPNNLTDSSNLYGRVDTRNELDAPLKLGPMSLTPYATGRETFWGDTPDEGSLNRLYGQAGVKATTNIWRVYNDVNNRLLDVDRLKHVMTPQVVAWYADTGVEPDQVYPDDPEIEQDLTRVSGFSAGLLQRLQTKRGQPGKEETVDWMRLDIVASFYNDPVNTLPADGRFYFFEPEYSLARNNVDFDYTWQMSDATTFLADANYDTDTRSLRRGDVGFAVERDPRVRYYAGLRYIQDLDSSVGTFGVNYQINRKYSVSVFEQYDFKFDNGTNYATSVTLIRRFPRWFGGFTVTYDSREDGSTAYSFYVTMWPEGVPEAHIGNGPTSLLGRSTEN
jgi:hypothetical protein